MEIPTIASQPNSIRHIYADDIQTLTSSAKRPVAVMFGFMLRRIPAPREVPKRMWWFEASAALSLSTLPVLHIAHAHPRVACQQQQDSNRHMVLERSESSRRAALAWGKGVLTCASIASVLDVLRELGQELH
eukprot:828835-Rhodomonas_salina.2